MLDVRIVWNTMAEFVVTLEDEAAKDLFDDITEVDGPLTVYDKENKTYLYLNRSHILCAMLTEHEEVEDNE